MKNLIYTSILFILCINSLTAQTTKALNPCYPNLPLPPAVTDNLNYISEISFDFAGNTVGKSVGYFNGLGKPTQSQQWDVITNKIWTSQTLYDYQGRGALKTLSAPSGDEFGFSPNFIREKTSSYTYGPAYFDKQESRENPALLKENSLLQTYYSTANTFNRYQDVTQYPFSRVIYSKLNPGNALRVIGGNKIDQDGNGSKEWANGYQFTMKAGNELTASKAFGSTVYASSRISKTVSRDVHGVETVMFQDSNGNILAAARSGNEEGLSGNVIRTNRVYMSAQGFVDIHVPIGCSGVQVFNGNGKTIYIYDLISEKRVYTSASNLPAGMYRFAIQNLFGFNENELANVYFEHQENYYDYSLNYYDRANRLVSSKQPLNKLESTFKYNTLGQLLETASPDEGTAKFKYRRDGQIRFSQNTKQASVNEVSYTDYDAKARPVESGVLTGVTFSSLDPDNTNTASYTKKEVVKTIYDKSYSMSTKGISNIPSCYTTYTNNYTQKFLAGNVSATIKEDPFKTVSIYSYDVEGRVSWMAQFLGDDWCPKLIEYEYDPVQGQVSKVWYQKDIPAEQFIHKYTYNLAGQLEEVSTSTDDQNYVLQANYKYNYSGELIRIELAGGLQGIDYVYNLNGQLKSINHPSLETSKDPGGDGKSGSSFLPDIFGLALDYNNEDYLRSNTPTPVETFNGGQNQFNGNIKSQRWKTQEPASIPQHIYAYDYNKNNWLTEAAFGEFNATGENNVEEHIIIDDEYIDLPEYEDGSSISFKASKSIVFKPGFVSDYPFEAKIVKSKGYTPSRDGDYKVDQLSYDANGNILSLNRTKNTESGTNRMDELSYTYYNGKNQLERIDDAVTQAVNATDIKDQNGSNYRYNTIGQLVENIGEGITYQYNAAGLVTRFEQTSTSTLVKFFYNDRGQRIKKAVSQGRSMVQETYYVRDASGTVMAIYEHGGSIEYPVYGQGRLGVVSRRSGETTIPNTRYTYELTDHLGNVRAVVQKGNSGGATALVKTDYYPFGMPMPNRNIEGNYRYKFQGQEKDAETGMEAFELRLWDSRIGRWLTTDPANQFYSPYLGMGNSPINGVDPDGAIFIPIGSKAKELWNEYKSMIIKTDKGKAIYDAIQNDKSYEVRVVYISELANNDNSWAYDENSKTIYISDGLTANQVKNKNKEAGSWNHPEWILAGHELKHAWDHYNLGNKFLSLTRRTQEKSAVKFQNYLYSVFNDDGGFRKGYGPWQFSFFPTDEDFNPKLEKIRL